ncbi:MAG: rod shape-determining protein RodA [Oscillospiraceae bacterium]|nr:rod shape-determining protein RodA [Oscillospiraceae bacterium]
MRTFFEHILRYFRRLDKSLFFTAAALSAFSVLLLWSIYANGAATINLTTSLYKNQFVASAGGCVIALLLSALDYNKLLKLWVLYAPAAIVLSLLTFTSLGTGVGDDRAWLDLGFITIQPSELLKVAFVTTFALHLSKIGDKINRFSNVLLLCVHAAVPTGLVLVQGDDGTASVFLMIFVIMLFSAGISLKYILPCCAALPVGVWLLWTRFLKPFQKMRIMVLFDDELDPLGVGYHQSVSKTALGSGQVFGKGLTGGEYVKVPEAANDFIFCYVGQCFGFIGCIAVMAALGFICVKIMINSRIAKDLTGKYICVGMYAMIFVHCILNLGMVSGLTPVIGVPLPFMSQGGTSVLAIYVGLGMVMSTYAHSEKKYHVFYEES